MWRVCRHPGCPTCFSTYISSAICSLGLLPPLGIPPTLPIPPSAFWVSLSWVSFMPTDKMESLNQLVLLAALESVMSFVKMAVKVLNNSNGGNWRRFGKGFCWLIYNQLLKWNLINLRRYMSLSGLVIWIVCNWFFFPESLLSISFIYFIWKMNSKNQSSWLSCLCLLFLDKYWSFHVRQGSCL